MHRVITKKEHLLLSKNPHFVFDGIKFSIKTALEELYTEGVSDRLFLNPIKNTDKAHQLCGAWIEEGSKSC